MDSKEQGTVVLKLTFIRNQASLDITSNTQEIVVLDPKQILGILGLRSLGYLKIRQGVLQQNLKSGEKLFEEFYTLVNELKMRKYQTKKNIHG